MIDTCYPADSVEFCPHPDAQDVLACGTYKLDQSNTSDRTGPQNRHGQCIIFRCTNDADPNAEKLQEFDLPAILDMKWCHRSPSSSAVLGIADSEGNISIHEWNLEQSLLKTTSSVLVAPSSNVLCLSLDWSNRRSPSTTLGKLIVSLSNGSLCFLQPSETGFDFVTESWHAHDYEPWIAAWNYWDTNVIFSGGDDLTMKVWDIRQGFQQPLSTNRRFEAGVTTIQSHPHVEHIIAVGSYDSSVRLFDTRKPLVPLTQVNVGGGAWRVKWHPSIRRKNDLLVACMHDGFKVIHFDDLDAQNFTGNISERYDKHESLAYGADWCFKDVKDDKTVVASCSFYDHSLHLWRG